jgi:heterodisulfide reductase subunit D
MKTTINLNDIQYAASICLKCGSCTYGNWPENHHLCSLYYRDPCFTHGGGGFMSIIAALGQNLLDLDQRMVDLAYTCSTCLNCDSRCSIIKAHPPQVNITDMVRLLRYEAVKRGLAPTGLAEKMQDNGSKAGGQTHSFTLPTHIQSENADTIIFAESGHAGSKQGVEAALISLLGKIGKSVAALPEGGSCGCAHYDYGFWDKLGPLMEANWERMKPNKEKTFVFTDPHCEEFIIKRYSENLADYTPIKHKHISQYLSDALREGKLQSKGKDRIKVSYHDPCYLGRGLGVYDAPREALSLLKGVELIEMPRNRVDSFCCGARVMGDYFADHGKTMAKERLDEFYSTGAELLITACPHCKEHFQKRMSDGEKNRIVDLVEFVDGRV